MNLNREQTTCAFCGATSVHTKHKPESFVYGSGDDAATLHVTVPVRICFRCGFEFTDAEADDIRQSEISRHLSVLGCL